MQRFNYPSWFQIQNSNNQQQQQQQTFQTQYPPPRTYPTEGNFIGPLGPPKPQWKYFQDLEFHNDSSSSWRLCVCTIDDKPFVCISHWFWSKASAQWLPSRRQINLQKDVFLHLVEKINQVTDSLNNIATEPAAAAASTQGRWIEYESVRVSHFTCHTSAAACEKSLLLTLWDSYSIHLRYSIPRTALGSRRLGRRRRYAGSSSSTICRYDRCNSLCCCSLMHSKIAFCAWFTYVSPPPL